MRRYPIAEQIAIIVALIIAIAPHFPTQLLEGQATYPYPPVEGDSWVYALGNVEEDGSFTHTHNIYLNISRGAGGTYILWERSENILLGGYESYANYTILSNWSVINYRAPGLSIAVEYKPPVPYVFHPRSPSDRMSINSSLTLYVETPNGTIVMRGSQSTSYIVNGTTWIVYNNTKIQAYVVQEYTEITLANTEYNISTTSITRGAYIINNSFKLPFVSEFTTETSYSSGEQTTYTNKMILQNHRITPDPLTTTTQKPTRTANTTTVAPPTTTATTTTETYTSSPSPTSTTPTNTVGQMHNLLIIVSRIGNYSGSDIPVKIRIQNLATGETVALVGINRTYSIRLPSSTYVISIEELEGRGGDGAYYYRFAEWKIPVDGSSRTSQDPSIQVRLDRDLAITIVVEVYIKQQGAVAPAQTQPGTTTTAAARGNITTAASNFTRTQAAVETLTTARAPIYGGGETEAPKTSLEAPEKPWYSNPIIVGSIAGGGAVALAATMVLRRRSVSRRAYVSSKGREEHRETDALNMPRYMQPPPTPQPATAGTSLKICSRCGASNPLQARFCKQCGAEFSEPQELKLCPHCGSPTKQGARFCPRCGSPI
jgi:RNA polymerase subunit RPABC4/transcription elongation factor Spt4